MSADAGEAPPVSGNLVITAQALDENHPFDALVLFIDGEATLVSSHATHRFELNTASLTEGRHLLWVEARQGNRVIGRSRRLAITVAHTAKGEVDPGPHRYRLYFTTAELPALSGRPRARTPAPPRSRKPEAARTTPAVAQAVPRPSPGGTSSVPDAGRPVRPPPGSRPQPFAKAPSAVATPAKPGPVAKAPAPSARVATKPPAPTPPARVPTLSPPPPTAKGSRQAFLLPDVARSTTPRKQAVLLPERPPPSRPAAKAPVRPVPSRPARSGSSGTAPTAKRQSAAVRPPPAVKHGREADQPSSPLSVPADLEALVTDALAVAMLLSALNLLAVLMLRVMLFLNVARRRQLLMIWRPLLMESLDDSLTNDPTSILRRRMAIRKSHHGKADWIAFLHLWNHLHESRQVQSKHRLNEVAHVMRAHQVARLAFLHSRELHLQLMAVATLGNMGERSAMDELARMCVAPDCFLSLASARALVHIDAHEAMTVLMPLLRTRTEWAPSKVVSILKEAGLDHRSGTEIISAPLAAATLEATREELPRMLRLLAAADCDSSQPTVREVLEQFPDDAELVSLCLRSLRASEQVAAARAYLDHPCAHLRLEAVLALARNGSESELAQLCARLDDDDEWVRACAARALDRLPTVTRQRLLKLQDGLASDRAREALDHVLSERAGR